MTAKKNVTRDSVTNLFKEFAGQGSTLVIPRPYIKLCQGDHLAALLLSQILYWTDRTTDPDGWFYKTYRDWHDELDMTQYQVHRAINGDPRGKKNGFPGLITLGVETKLMRVNNDQKKGAATLHYRVNLDVLAVAVRSQFSPSNDDDSQPPVINNVHNGVINNVHNDIVNNVDNDSTETTSKTTSEIKNPAPSGAVPVVSPVQSSALEEKDTGETPEKTPEPPIPPPPLPPTESEIIVGLIKAWLDEAGVIQPTAYGNKTIRGQALEMHKRGVTADHIRQYIQAKRSEPFWKEKEIQWAKVAGEILPWMQYKKLLPKSNSATAYIEPTYYMTSEQDQAARIEMQRLLDAAPGRKGISR